MPIFGQVLPQFPVALGNLFLTNPYPISQSTTLTADLTLPGDGTGIQIAAPFSPAADPVDISMFIHVDGVYAYHLVFYADTNTPVFGNAPGSIVNYNAGSVVSLTIETGPKTAGQRFGVILIPKA